jgi:hypothetical protein
MNLFYKTHLQAFTVISIVLYHSGPTFGKVFYSCLDAFVVDASDYSGHLTFSGKMSLDMKKRPLYTDYGVEPSGSATR